MINAILRGVQFLFAIICLALSSALVAQQGVGGSSSIANYSVFVSIFVILCLFYFSFVVFKSDSGSPMILTALDAICLLFTFAGAVALAADLHVHSCSNSEYTLHNALIYGGGARDRKGRCHEAQALCAFMWFLFGAFIPTTALSVMGFRSGGGGSRPAMSQV